MSWIMILGSVVLVSSIFAMVAYRTSKNDKVGETGTTRAVNSDEHHLIGAVKKRNKAFTKVVRKGLGWRRTEVSDESLA